MNEHSLRVSVITLSFNQGRFLDRALCSVLEQDYPVEYIVVDPGSTDGSRELIEQHRDQLAQIVFEPDDGPADGLNKAFRLATGDIVVCLNSDDELLPGAIAAAVASFERHPDAACIYADGYRIDELGRPTKRICCTDFDLRRFALGAVTVMHQATFVRRDAFWSVGGFNPRNQTCWDAELIVDLAAAGLAIRHVPGLWAAFRVHPDSITGSGRLAVANRDDLSRLFEKVFGRAPTPRDRHALARARVEKFIRNPRCVAWRLGDRIRKPSIARQA